MDKTIQDDITRLSRENQELRETIDKQADEIRQLKELLKVYTGRSNHGEATQSDIVREATNPHTNGQAPVGHSEDRFLGMLDYRKEDEGALLKNLILDLEPDVATGFFPTLPAYILFMCVRHADFTNDIEKAQSLLTGATNSIKKVMEEHPSDTGRYSMWLANSCQMLHILNQYSGEKILQTGNTSKQNEQRLQNIDISEYQEVFNDLTLSLFTGLTKLMEKDIQPIIVPAVLEHEAVAGLSASQPSGLRGHTVTDAQERDEEVIQHALDALVKKLSDYLRIVTLHNVNPELVKQLFRQLFYFISADSLNNLLLRKDICTWSEGIQITKNIAHLKEWLTENSLQDCGAWSSLQTIVQASKLLQARKTDADVDCVCEMCSQLSAIQIVKLLHLYTPVDVYDERVSMSFIRKIQEKLKDKQGTDNALLMETGFLYPVCFPFIPSSIAVETIEVPEELSRGILKRL